jgi:hypothetical protein
LSRDGSISLLERQHRIVVGQHIGNEFAQPGSAALPSTTPY